MFWGPQQKCTAVSVKRTKFVLGRAHRKHTWGFSWPCFNPGVRFQEGKRLFELTRIVIHDDVDELTMP